MYNQYSATKNDRRGFIKKVYSLLLIQLTMTVVFIALVVSIPQMREGIKRTVGLFYAALGIMLVLILAIMCFKKVARRYPWNYIALFTFTIFLSYIVAFISAFYNPFVVLSAVLLTFVVTLSLTIYAFKTKSDFTVCGGVLVSVTTSLILFGFLMIFFHPFYVNMIFCEIAIVLYSVFIVYDTQLIAGGRYNEISFDDYVIGALMLYVDIIGLFLYIMSLLGAKK
jgi:FtsH-binding integral membrane protein